MCPPDDKPVLLVAPDGTIVALHQSAAVRSIALPPGKTPCLSSLPAPADFSLPRDFMQMTGFYVIDQPEADTPVTIGPSAMTAGSETGRALRPAEPRPAE